MTSFSGSVAYLEYVSKSEKGGIGLGDRFNGVFDLGNIQNPVERMNFTGQAVVEAVDSFVSGTTKLAWYPVAKKIVAGQITEDLDIKFLDVDGEELTATGVSVNGADGTVTATIASGTVKKIAYKYNQEYIPAHDIPTIGPVMRSIPLIATPRRIAVKYDQITAYQA